MQRVGHMHRHVSRDAAGLGSGDVEHILCGISASVVLARWARNDVLRRLEWEGYGAMRMNVWFVRNGRARHGVLMLQRYQNSRLEMVPGHHLKDKAMPYMNRESCRGSVLETTCNGPLDTMYCKRYTTKPPTSADHSAATKRHIALERSDALGLWPAATGLCKLDWAGEDTEHVRRMTSTKTK